MAGELKIIATQDLGRLSDGTGKPVIYNWKFYYNVPGVVPWIILALVIVLVKDNRTPKAMPILIPLLIINGIVFLIFKSISSFASEISQFSQLFISVSMSLATLWLLSHKIGNRNRFATFMLAMVIMGISLVVYNLAYSCANFSFITGIIIVISGVVSSPILFSMALCGWLCRKRYGGLKFMLLLGVSMIMLTSLVLAGYAVLSLIFNSGMGIGQILLMVLVQVLLLSCATYVILLPYMILAMSSDFYRERFFSCFRLTGMVDAKAEVVREAEAETVVEDISEDPDS